LADKAIELGIALEAALIPEGREREEPVSYHVRLRAAWLHEGSIDERRHVRSVIKNVYDLRSQAVHKGALQDKKKKENRRTLHEGMLLCASLLRKLVSLETEPNWREIELGGHLIK
jgi:hypothetical protein